MIGWVKLKMNRINEKKFVESNLFVYNAQNKEIIVHKIEI